MSKIKSIVAAGAIVVAALTLAACSSTPTAKPASKPAASTHAAPVKTTAPAPAKTTAPPKSAWDQEQAAKATYKLDNGQTVAIDSSSVTLPQQVNDEIVKDLGPGDQAHIAQAVTALSADSAKLGGRGIIPVTYGLDGNTGRNDWGVGGRAAGAIPVSNDKAMAVAAANAWVAANGGGSAYVIVVGN